VSEEKDAPEVMSVLMNEQFILQSVSGITVSESGSRSALYLSAFSSGLVAIGFASNSRALLASLAFTILPTVFILGCFTINRLIDTTAENIVAQGRIRMIRAYYAKISPRTAQFFPVESGQTLKRPISYSIWSIFFTMASMVVLVNGVLGGAIIALVISIALHGPTVIAVPVGIFVGIALVILGLFFQERRIGPLMRDASGGASLELPPSVDSDI
jgi:hypothetical protein